MGMGRDSLGLGAALMLLVGAAAAQDAALSHCGNPAEPPERAVRFCTEALRGRLQPAQEALAALNLGLAQAQLENHREAVAAFDRALKADPREVRALAGRARAREALGQRGDAGADWDRALSLSPRNAALLEGRGAFRLRGGEAAGAAADFEAAARIEPKQMNHRFNLGLALAELGRDAEAEQAFSAVIAAEPNDASAWLNRARLRAARDARAALADFDRAVALGGEWSLPWFERGLMKDTMGDKAGADRDFRRAWELGHRSEFLDERIRRLRP
jgi:Tfp pilus assembly protein PilF